jgi:hypothetical protein
VQRSEITRAITDEALHLQVQLGIRLAAIEERHLVTRRERSIRHGSPEEARPAEEEELHASSASPASSRSTSSSVL